VTQPHSGFFLQQDDAEESPVAGPKRDVANGRQANTGAAVRTVERGIRPGIVGSVRLPCLRDGFRWQLIGRNGTRRGDMSGSATAIWIIVAVAVAGLAVWLGSVALAARKPYQGRAYGERLRGTVQGGMHVGAGRSVAPRRDEPVASGEVPAGDTLHPGAEDPADAGTGLLVPGTGRTSAAAGGKL
jgi:hypothetical protein